MVQTAVDDPPIDAVEILFADQEGVMLRLDIESGIGELDQSALIESHGDEWTPCDRLGKTEQRSKERSRKMLVVSEHDGVVEGDRHDYPCRSGASMPDAARHRHATLGEVKHVPPIDDKATSRHR